MNTTDEKPQTKAMYAPPVAFLPYHLESSGRNQFSFRAADLKNGGPRYSLSASSPAGRKMLAEP
jgi:hypothetical protein